MKSRETGRKGAKELEDKEMGVVLYIHTYTCSHICNSRGITEVEQVSVA